MGGGGLAFLNKKTWHPGRLDNQEEKWKREQAAAKEQTRLNELKKQIALERQQEELHAVAQAAGVKEASNRLDWMYQGGMVAKAEADKRNEEQMLGARPVDLDTSAIAAAAPPGQPEAVKLPTFYAEDTAASANEVWSRIHSDPLFAIRQQEIAARKSIAANPVKMDAIKAEVAKLQAAGEAAKAQRRAAKQAKRDAKAEAKAARKAEKKAAKAAPAAAEAPAANGHGSEPARKRARSASLDGHAARPKQEREARNGHSNGHADARGNGHAEHRHREDRDREAERRDRGDEGRDNRRGRESGDRHANGHGSRHGHGSSGRQERREEEEGARPRAHVFDGASAQGKDLKYGLNFGGAAPEGVQTHDRSELAAATQKRLEEAAVKREEEEREKAAQRHVRKEYKTGRMTEEQRAVRLAEMAGNASVHEEARWVRQKRAREADAAEEDANATQPTDDEQRRGTAAFLKEAHKEVYGAAGEGATLEDRVGRRKYYAERGGAAAFRR